MEKSVIKVEGMSCEHCVKAVTDAVKGLSGIESVSVSLKDKNACVEFDPSKVNLSDIKAAIEEQGYDIVA
ncbi:MAG: copper chaperone CopZ [Elusimicrobiota bacterium]|jgi:copper chaperone|nr:copper chaperone CopZ [Elusimicrobiota bacterium]